jgi:hypothetical protein
MGAPSSTSGAAAEPPVARSVAGLGATTPPADAPPMPMSELLPPANSVAIERITIEQAAQICRVSVRTMRRMAASVDSLAVKIGSVWQLHRVNVELLAHLGSEGYLARIQARRTARAAANAAKSAVVPPSGGIVQASEISRTQQCSISR